MRVAQLVETQRRITAERNRRYIGQDLEILVEGDATRSSTQAMGKTDGNITVVWDKSTGDFRPGTLTTNISLTPRLQPSMGSKIPGIPFTAILAGNIVPFFGTILDAKRLK